MSYQEFVQAQQIKDSKAAVAKQTAKEEAQSAAIEMSYSEYKNKYASCKTVSDSYNKKTKTIFVIINNTDAVCPICHTHCYGDCGVN